MCEEDDEPHSRILIKQLIANSLFPFWFYLEIELQEKGFLRVQWENVFFLLTWSFEYLS